MRKFKFQPLVFLYLFFIVPLWAGNRFSRATYSNEQSDSASVTAESDTAAIDESSQSHFITAQQIEEMIDEKYLANVRFPELKSLLHSRTRLDEERAKKIAALLYASASRGDLTMFSLIFNDGRFYRSDLYNWGLINAAWNGHTDIVRLLLTDPRVDPVANDDQAIRFSASRGHTEVVKILLSQPKVDPTALNYFAVNYAATNGHLEVVKLLMNHDKVKAGNHFEEAFRTAAEHGHIEIVQFLMYHPKVWKISEDAIGAAAKNGHEEIVHLLLHDSRVNPSANDNYAIAHAPMSGNVAIVRMLVHRGVDPSARDNEALFWAMKCRKNQIIGILFSDERVQRGLESFRSRSSDHCYRTTMFYVPMFKILYEELNFDPSIQNNLMIRIIAYWWCSQHDVTLVRNLLEDRRVDPRADNNFAIRYAAARGHTDIVRLLLADGRVDPRADNNYASRMASANDHTEIVEMIEAYNRRRFGNIGAAAPVRVREPTATPPTQVKPRIKIFLSDGCPICLEKYNDDKMPILVGECGHLSCSECCEKLGGKCPVCRARASL